VQSRPRTLGPGAEPNAAALSHARPCINLARTHTGA
jgi:hypothetical protein